MSDSSIIIAKRSISLGKTFVVIAIALCIVGIGVGNIDRAFGGFNVSQVPVNSSSTGQAITLAIPFVTVPMLSFAALAFTTPVLLLYVYDKNNGVLEYFLSLGMNQGDIYRSYLKAALLLGAILLAFADVTNIIVGLIVGVRWLTLFEISFLIPALALTVVSFVSIAMMAFSSLQKQRVGANQPLGIALGVLPVFPTYLIPFIVPSFAFDIDLLVVGSTILITIVMLLSASKLVRREKMLP